MISKTTAEPRRGVPLRADWGAYERDGMATLVRSVLVAANTKINPEVTSEAFIRRRGWGESELASIGLVLRAAANPAQTSTAGWAKELAQVVPILSFRALPKKNALNGH